MKDILCMSWNEVVSLIVEASVLRICIIRSFLKAEMTSQVGTAWQAWYYRDDPLLKWTSICVFPVDLPCWTLQLCSFSLYACASAISASFQLSYTSEGYVYSCGSIIEWRKKDFGGLKILWVMTFTINYCFFMQGRRKLARAPILTNFPGPFVRPFLGIFCLKQFYFLELNSNINGNSVI